MRILICSVPNFSWDVSLKEFAHPNREVSIDLAQLLPPFFFAAAMFGFVFQMSSLITEKELKLRQVIWVSSFPCCGVHCVCVWLVLILHMQNQFGIRVFVLLLCR